MVEQRQRSEIANDTTTKDALGFETRAKTVLKMILESQCPIFVSVEGGWGAGKTTFLLELKARAGEITDPHPSKTSHDWLKLIVREKPRVVSFSPWNAAADEEVWVAFASAFEEQMRKAIGRPDWIRLRTWARLRKLIFHRNWLRLGRASAAVAVLIVAWWTVDRIPWDEISVEAFFKGWQPKDFFSLTTSLIAISTALLAFRHARPKRMHERAPAALRTQREVLEFVAPLCGASSPITIIMIDDLDRCRPENVSRMISLIAAFLDGCEEFANSVNVAFLVAMDREKVAAALAADSEATIPYLEPSVAGSDVGKARRGLRNAHEYLEKIVNLTVRVPSVNSPLKVLEVIRAVVDPTDQSIEDHEQTRHAFVLSEVIYTAQLLRYNPRSMKRLARDALLHLRKLDALGWRPDRTLVVRAMAVLLAVPELVEDLRRDAALWPRLVHWASAGKSERLEFIEHVRKHKKPMDTYESAHWQDKPRSFTRRDLVWVDHLNRNPILEFILRPGDGKSDLDLSDIDIRYILGIVDEIEPKPGAEATSDSPGPSDLPPSDEPGDKSREDSFGSEDDSLGDREARLDGAESEAQGAGDAERTGARAGEAAAPLTAPTERSFGAPSADADSDVPGEVRGTASESPREDRPKVLEDLDQAINNEADVARKLGYTEAHVRAMIATAYAMLDAGRYERGLAKAAEARELARKVTGERHPVVAEAVRAIGYAEHFAGRYEESLDHFNRALAIHRDTLSDGHPSVAIDLRYIGTALHGLGRLDEAMDYHKRALTILRKSLGNEDSSVATNLNELGLALWDLGRLDESLDHFERALAIARKSLGDDHPSVATNLINIGGVLRDLGRLDESLDHFERALAIDQKSLGDDHPLVAKNLINIGSVLRDLGRLDESLDHFERALAIDQKSLGNDHPQVAIVLGSIGDVLRDLGRLDESLDHHERALAIDRKSRGDRHPYTAFDRLEVAKTRHAMGERDGVLDEIEDAYRGLLRAGAPVGGRAVRAARILFRLGGDPLAICRDELGDEVAEEVRDAMNGPWFGRYDNPAGPIEGL